MALPSTMVSFPFSGGLNTRGDKRLQNPPALDVALNVEFDDTGALRTRHPFTTGNFGANVDSSGSPLATCRKAFTFNDELLVFDKTRLLSWDASQSKWVSRGTHLAVDVDEHTRFASNGDQYDVDRAELSNVVVYAWIDGGKPYVAAYSKTTGAVIQAPTQIPTNSTVSSMTRVIALDTKIVVLFVADMAVPANSGLMGFAVDPANVASSIASGIASPTPVWPYGSAFSSTLPAYDVVSVPGSDMAVIAVQLAPNTSYGLTKLTSGMSVLTYNIKARPCVGPIALSIEPTNTSVQIVRDCGNVAGTFRIRGDFITISTLADVYTNQEIGTYTTPSGASYAFGIACAHRSIQNGGQYRCYVFWSFEKNGLAEAVKTNWVDTGNTLGTQSMLLAWCSLGSRAFSYDGSVYVWAFYGRLDATGDQQGQYLLYRDDGFLTAGSRIGNAFYPQSVGHLPNVALTDGTTGFTWAGMFMRNVPTSPDLPFIARAPREIAFSFDSNNARRVAKFGNTLYISGSPVLQYDGVQLTEVGFRTAPSALGMVDIAVAGHLSGGTYAWKPTLRWVNAVGEVDRSASFIVGTAVITATHSAQFVGSVSNYPAVWTTRKVGVTWEVWRTQVNPTADSPFYLVTSQDPKNVTLINGYLANSRTATQVAVLSDDITDTALITGEENPQNGNVLENLPPPAAKIVLATDTRLFLGGVAGDQNRVWYSKQRADGFVASFHDTLAADVPEPGGDITALAILDNNLIVFRESAIYLLGGDGFDSTGGGSNYGPARTISIEVGADNHECVVHVPDGLLFKCSKGWYLLNRGLSVQYIGAAVYAYDAETPLAAALMPAQHQVRIVTASRMLVWDYYVNQWGEWTIADALDATVWGGQHVYLAAAGPKIQNVGYAGIDYGFDVESSWIKVNNITGRGMVREIQVLGEYRGAHQVRVRLARNYESDGAGGWSYFQDKTWSVSPRVIGGPEQLKFAPSIKRPIEAIKVRLTAIFPVGGVISGYSPGDPQINGETAKLTGLSLAIADEGGLYTGLPSAQKA